MSYKCKTKEQKSKTAVKQMQDARPTLPKTSYFCCTVYGPGAFRSAASSAVSGVPCTDVRFE